MEEAKRRMRLINPYVNFQAINALIDKSNANTYLKDHDVVVDALDNIETRLLIQYEASKLKIPMVHGAIGGFYGQVTTIFPDDFTLDILYPNGNREGRV